MQQRAQRHQRGARLAGRVGVVLVVVIRGHGVARSPPPRFLANVGLGFESIAGRPGEPENGAADRGHADQRQYEPIAADGVPRQRQNRVADDAAEPGRQRPAIGDGKQRGRHRRAENAEQPEQNAQARAFDRAVREQAKRQRRDRQQRGAGGDADRLHEQIGDDGAGHAEQIMHPRVGRLVERRIARGPGEQGQGHGRASGEREQSSRFRGPPSREMANDIGRGAESLAARHGSR